MVVERLGTLLVPVPGLSGITYPTGTQVVVRGHQGATVDAFVNGDWLPLAWWEFAPFPGTTPEPGSAM